MHNWYAFFKIQKFICDSNVNIVSWNNLVGIILKNVHIQKILPCRETYQKVFTRFHVQSLQDEEYQTDISPGVLQGCDHREVRRVLEQPFDRGQPQLVPGGQEKHRRHPGRQRRIRLQVHVPRGPPGVCRGPR